MNPLARALRAADKVAAVIALAGVGALMLAIVVVMADIAARKSIGVSIRGTIDLTQLAQMACAFLALPYVFLREGHIAVEFATERLPRKVQTVVSMLAALVTFALMATIAWYSFGQAAIQVKQGDSSMTLGIPILYYWVPTLAGLALSCVSALLVTLRHAVQVAGGADPAAAARA